MRPATLSEAVTRIELGEPAEKAWPEFLDTFYLAPDQRARAAVLADEPAFTGDPKLDALAAASASYLSKLFRLPVPTWTADRRRVLDEPWFTGVSDAPGMREYLTFSSPAEFRCRNIFTEERPLRRARSAPALRAVLETEARNFTLRNPSSPL
jgi:hypothetical protein